VCWLHFSGNLHATHTFPFFVDRQDESHSSEGPRIHISPAAPSGRLPRQPACAGPRASGWLGQGRVGSGLCLQSRASQSKSCFARCGVKLRLTPDSDNIWRQTQGQVPGSSPEGWLGPAYISPGMTASSQAAHVGWLLSLGQFLPVFRVWLSSTSSFPSLPPFLLPLWYCTVRAKT
jgi:hypothetical protein